VAAWRHIVTVFRGQSADSVTWLWTVWADEAGTGPDHLMMAGHKVRHLDAIDGYYRPSVIFVGTFGKTLAQIRAFTRLSSATV
jgi:hypothetical protein